MTISPTGRYRINVTGVRGGVSAELQELANRAEAAVRRDPAVQPAFGGGQAMYDRDGSVYGTPRAFYFPLVQGYDAPGIGDLGLVANAPCTEVPGYCKITIADAGTYYTIVFNKTNRIISAVQFDALPALQAANPSQIVNLASCWGEQVTTELDIVRLTPAPRAQPSADEIRAWDEANLRRSQSLKTQTLTHLQQPIADYNVWFAAGQSFAFGSQTRIALSTTPRFGNKMLGDAPVAALTTSKNYVLRGPTVLTDLVAKSVTADGSTILSPSAAAALPEGDQASGEAMNVGFTNGAKYLFNQRRIVANDPRIFVTFNTAVPGQPIAAFRKPNGSYYGRDINAMQKVNTAVSGASVAIVAELFDQGQWDYAQEPGGGPNGEIGVNRKPVYKAQLNGLFDDQNADLIPLASAQTLPFAKFFNQTGGVYSRNLDADGVPGLAIGMAQIEVALERRDAFMVGGTYQYQDLIQHLTAEGSLAASLNAAKVADLVVHGRQPWEPLRPIWFEIVHDYIYIGFHVPAPPLAFRSPFVGKVLEDQAGNDYGIYVTRINNDGSLGPAITTSRPEIVGQSIIRCKLATVPPSQIAVWNAQGNGNSGIFDSDPTELEGRRLYNACVAFFYVVTPGVRLKIPSVWAEVN